jgi:hypothetical protein
VRPTSCVMSTWQRVERQGSLTKLENLIFNHHTRSKFMPQPQFHRRIFRHLLLGVGTLGKGSNGRRATDPLRPFCLVGTKYHRAYNVSGVPPTPLDPQGTLDPLLPLPLPIGTFGLDRSSVYPVCIPRGARQCFPFSGEGRKRMLPRGASSIRGVFLVLTRHETRSRCCGVDRSQKTNGFDTPVYGSAFGERA